MFSKIGVLNNFAKFKGEYLFGVSFLNKAAGLRPVILLKETPTQVFLFELCEIFKNTFFYRTLAVAVSIIILY